MSTKKAHEVNLGKVPGDGALRDAVHIAVAPVVAAETLMPGACVGLRDDGTGATVGVRDIGVVDPFRTTRVQKGERFWLFLYPQTITTLRHEWTHPAFPDAQVVVPEDSLHGRSEAWIRSFAAGHGETYNTIMDAAKDYLESGAYLCRGGKFEGEYVPDEFWHHYEIVTGQPLREGAPGSFFTCSC